MPMKMKTIGNLERRNVDRRMSIWTRERRRSTTKIFSLINLWTNSTFTIVSFHSINSGKTNLSSRRKDLLYRWSSPRTQHVVIPLISSPISSNSNGHEICLKRRHLSPTRPPSPSTSSSSTAAITSHYLVRSPLNLVEDEQSSTCSIILFKDDDVNLQL